MASRLRAAIGLTLVLSGGGCALVWSYGSFEDQPGQGGGGHGGAGGAGGHGGNRGHDTEANGEACTLGSDCTSGHCEPAEQGDGGTDAGTDAGGICCAGACGTCQMCTADGAMCAAVPKGEPGPSCPSGTVCDGQGACAVPNGGMCPADAGACLSTLCVGSICCATPCTTCQTCAPDGSQCAFLPVGAMDPGCPAPMICDGSGNCVTPQ